MSYLSELPFLQLFQDQIHKKMTHPIFFVLSINSSQGCILLWIPTIPSLDFFVLWVSEIHNRMSFLVYLPLLPFISSSPRLFPLPPRIRPSPPNHPPPPLPSKNRQNQKDYLVRIGSYRLNCTFVVVVLLALKVLPEDFSVSWALCSPLILGGKLLVLCSNFPLEDFTAVA